MPDVMATARPTAAPVPAMTRRPRGPRSRRGVTSLLFLLPLLLLLGAFLFYPLVSAVDLSFRSAKTFATVQAPFVGLRNYRSLLDDPGFSSLVWHSFIRGFGGALPSYLLGLAAALALNIRRRGMAVLRVIALIPFVLSAPVAVNTWLQLLDPHFGLFGTHLGNGNSLLADPKTVWPTLLFINTWFSFQFYAILLLAALQRIPSELYEAAQVDGANVMQRFLHVTMPALARPSAVFLAIHFMLSFQEVNLVLVATGGGPANATQTLATYAYSSGFRSFNIGFAAAASIVSCILMFAALAALALLAYLLLRLRRAAKEFVLSRARRRVRSGVKTVTRQQGASRVPAHARPKLPRSVGRVIGYVPATCAAAAAVAPLLFLASQSFDGQPAGAQKMSWLPRQPTLDNYIHVLGNPDLLRSGRALPPLLLNLFDSMMVAALMTAIVLVIAAPAGYGLSHARTRWARVMTAVIVVVQFVPPVLLVFPLYHELALLNLLNSRVGLALVTGVLATPLATLLFRTFFDGSARELEEAAAVDGANPLRIFRSVVMPMSRPVVGAVAAFALIGSWNEFLFSLTFIADDTKRTLPPALYIFASNQQSNAVQTSPGQQAVYLVVPVILAVAVLALTQRHITAAYQGGGVKE